MAREAPLRNRRAKARADADLLTLQRSSAIERYPFDDISSRLQVNVSNRAKRLALRLCPKTRTMNLVVPPRASMKAAYEFARENEDWIRERLKELPRPVRLRDGAVIPVFGRERRIVVLYNENLKCTDILLKKDEIIVMTNKENPSARIKRFLIEETRERITALADEKCAAIRRKYSSITIRDTVSRWGSCSSDRRLSFSWRLAFAPKNAFDYVVAHEVSHLVYMDHSDNFWTLCESVSRDFDGGVDWMRQHAHTLMRYNA